MRFLTNNYLEKEMQIKPQSVNAVLEMLIDAYPMITQPEDWQELEDCLSGHEEVMAVIVYLQDKKLIESNLKFTASGSGMPWQGELKSIRVNAAGHDFYNGNQPTGGNIRRR